MFPVMNNETLAVLKSLNINVPTGATFPEGDTFNHPLSIVKRGNVTVLLCGDEATFDLVANHGAMRRAREVREVSGRPYLTVPTSRLPEIFGSIARMRLLATGRNKGHQKIAPALAAAWIAALPVESDAYWVKEIAADSICAEVE
jgi:hypothetical protein